MRSTRFGVHLFPLILVLASVLGISSSNQEKPLSLPQYDSGNASQRALDLLEMQGAIQNGPRFHKIANVDKVFQYFPGPQSGPLADSMIAAEAFDVSARGEPEMLGAILRTFQSNKLNLTSLEDLANMYHAFEDVIEFPTSAISWDHDSSFAADRLTINGFKLEATRTVPFPIEDDVVCEITGHSMRWLLKKKWIFKIDLSREGGFSPKDSSKYVPGVQALFFFTQQKQFSVLAIHIVDSGLTYTPLDHPDHWQFAKLAFSATEFNYQLWEHFSLTHLVHEPVRVEMMRHLSSRHPVNALLSHHYKNLFGLTSLARQLLLQNGTRLDNTVAWGAQGSTEFIAQRSSEIHWSNLDIRVRMKLSGLSRIPGYKYRDDALELRSIILAFVKDYLRPYYRTNRVVQEDHELQSFALATSTFVAGFPTCFRNFEMLSNTITDIIFSICVKHHTMNTNAAWMSGALPANPKALWAPLPTSKSGPISPRAFIAPTSTISQEVLLAASIHRDLKPEESLIFSYNNASLGSRSAKSISRFQTRLELLSKRIQHREEKEKRPFVILDPARLPYFVWI